MFLFVQCSTSHFHNERQTKLHCSWHGPEPMIVSDPSLRLHMLINFPLCGNHAEWRSSCLLSFFFYFYFYFLLFPLPSVRGMVLSPCEICDWLCLSISRYVGTRLNGAVSRIMLSFYYLLPLRSSVLGFRCDLGALSILLAACYLR